MIKTVVSVPVINAQVPIEPALYRMVSNDGGINWHSQDDLDWILVSLLRRVVVKVNNLNHGINMRQHQPWTKRESNAVWWNWNRVDLAYLSNKMGRSESAIIQHAYTLNLPPKVKRNITPPEVIEYIRTNIGKLSVKRIAANTGYTVPGIYDIARRYNISIKRKY